VKVRRTGHSETLAVAALILPLLGLGLMLAFRSDSWAVQMGLSCGTLFLTAVLLTIDAAMLGTTDLKGTRRASAGALFAGMILLWIVCYPVAYFRRRHFGRPNLGPLAILVALFFVAVPIVQDFLRFGVLGGPPSCTSSEVVSMVNDLIRKSAMGLTVQSISGHKEISYDAKNEVRKGECQVKTQTETIRVTYSVKMINRLNGTFQVIIDPTFSQELPPCTSPEVTALVEQLLRQQPDGHQLLRVTGHREVFYDAHNKVRHGHCEAAMQGWNKGVNFIVFWHDQKTGQFEVQLER
jgi:hypothetical protein